MSWSRRLSKPIALYDGRQLATLDDVAEFVLALPSPRLHKLCWDEAIELLVDAATGQPTSDAMAKLEARIAAALQVEGFVLRPMAFENDRRQPHLAARPTRSRRPRRLSYSWLESWKVQLSEKIHTRVRGT